MSIKNLVLIFSCCITAAFSQVKYSDNFESSLSNWQITGGGWQSGTPTLNPTTVPQGTKCAGTILIGDYANNANYQMTMYSSGWLDPGSVGAVSFFEWVSVEDGFDSCFVDIERTSSGSWTTIYKNATSLTSWVERTFDVRSLAGGNVRLRFRFKSNGSGAAKPGWYIDSVRIYQATGLNNVTVTAGSGGTVNPTGSVAVASGAKQTVIAAPSAGYTFANWEVLSGGVTITDPASPTTTISLTSNGSIRANFISSTSYTLTVSNGSGGNVTPSGTVSLASGAIQPITATPSAGYVFSNWEVVSGSATIEDPSSASTTVAISGTASIRANFTTTTYSLVITSGTGGSTLPVGTISLAPGISRSITATPTSGYVFTSWTLVSGSAVIDNVTAATTAITISGNASIRANFTAATYPLTITTGTGGTVSPVGTVTQAVGAARSITATASAGYLFSHWEVVSGSAEIADITSAATSVTISGTASIRANFTTVSYSLTIEAGTGGTVTPAGAIDLAAGVSRTITATPSTGYFFASWTVISGSADIANIVEATTSVSITGDATIRANFSTGEGPSLSPAMVTATRSVGEILEESKNLFLPADVSPPMSDIIFIMDLTGSMGGALSNVKINSVNIMNEIRTLIPDTRFGVMSHMDYYGSFSGCGYSASYGSSGDVPYRLNRPLTNDVSAVATAINALSLGSGSDGPESYTRPLYETYADPLVNWRPGSKRIVLFWHDMLPHDCNYGLDTLPGRSYGPDPGRDAIAGTDDDLDLATVLDSMAYNKITLISLHSGGNNALWDYYGRKTGGRSFQINSSGTIPGGVDIATYLTGLIREEVKNIDTLTLVTCTPDFDSWLTALEPPYYTGITLDSDKEFTFDIAFTVPAGTSPGKYEFEVCATGDGVKYAGQQVTITVPGGTTQPPIAVAGADKTVSAGELCEASVVLDGSDSYDPDGGSIVSYLWELGMDISESGATPSVVLPVGVNEIRLIVVDDEGSSDTDTVVVTVVDDAAPIPPLLPEITAECAVSLIAPIGTDNCAERIIGTTTDPLTYSEIGTYLVTWTFIDGAGNSSIATQSVVVEDVTAPVPDIDKLPSLTGSCSVSITAGPTATDNCSGTITGTTTDPTEYTEQGEYIVHWVYTDEAGNTQTQEQAVIVNDDAVPVPDVATLPNVTGVCLATITTIPTATDNCTGTITASTSDPLEYTESGTYTVHWTFTDEAGNSTTQDQVVVIEDVSAPVPDAATLPVVTGGCSATVTATPTATDECSGTITATTSDPLEYTESGTYTVHWTFTDESGNSTTQEQVVVIEDVSAPVPDIATLPVVTGECSATITVTPTATDDCSGTITATTSDPLEYTESGTYTIHWTFTDDAGNSATQNQEVVIEDVTAPILDEPVLEVVTGECSVTITAIPTATDNCSGVIKGSTTDPLTYSTAGSYTVHWLFTDASGNSTSQIQEVVIADKTAPVPTVASLPEVTSECSVTLTPPTATDKCGGEVTGTTPTLIFASQGTHTVIWTYTDASGNSATQEQKVVVHDATPPILEARSDTSVFVAATIRGALVSLRKNEATDNCLPVAVTARRTDGKPLDSLYLIGTTTVWWTACDANGNCDSTSQKVTVSRNRAPIISEVADTTIDEGVSLKIRVTASDSDGVIPTISASGLPDGAVFSDSGSGVGHLSFIAGCSSHGSYSITLSATDGVDTVKESFVLTIKDLNFAPKFVDTHDTTAPENSALSILIRTEDCDGDVPKIRAISIPGGSVFKDNGDGTGTFLWTPECDENGFYIVVFEATDDHTTVRDTMLIRITDVNCYDPELTLSTTDTTTGINLPLSIVIHASDRDNDIPSLESRGLPAGATFTADADGNAVFAWTPKATGTYTSTIVAVDAADPSVRIETTIRVKVVDDNFSGPVFSPVSDTIIDENQLFELTIKATDPDGTVPAIEKVKLPADAELTDNGNGTAKVSWLPGCASNGSHEIVVSAFDGLLTDTLTVLVVVRDFNCAPVINPVTNKNVAFGSTIRFTVSATDPDNDVTPDLSVKTSLPDFTFTIPKKGEGVFEWKATYTSGSYPVTFYASDGYRSDTGTVIISIDQVGSIHLVAKPSGTALYRNPAGGALGEFIGTDTATVMQVPGTYWFAANAPGYRTSVFTGTVSSEAICTVTVELKPLIPLMIAVPETLQVSADISGSIAFVDYDGDGIQDLSVAHGGSLKIYPGSDAKNGRTYRTPAITIDVPSTLDSIVAHTYSDWNNDGTYDCILSLRSGVIKVADFSNEALVVGPVQITRSGDKMFPVVTDINNDKKKDLIMVIKGKGIYLFKNEGTDEVPAFGTRIKATASGSIITNVDAALNVFDFSGNGEKDLVVAAGEYMRLFAGSRDSTLERFGAGEDLNAGGKRLPGTGTASALLLIPKQLPRLVTLRDGKLIGYPLRLSGDINADGTVNITDISKIAKAWELTDDDNDWNPACNLNLSPVKDGEVIDIKDISKASKNWELEE